MADTRRSLSSIIALFANNTTGDISAQDLRDFVMSVLFNNITVVSTGSHNLASDDEIIHVTYTTTGAVTIDLTSAYATDGKVLFIKDAGGNANVNNITVTTEGAETIDGENTVVINVDYAGLILYCYSSNWFIL